MKILVLNAGSSSHKVSLYQLGENLPDDPPPPLWEAKIDWHDHIGADAVEQLITTLWRGKSPVLRSSDDIDMVGHRIVHGGRQYEEPVRITPAVKAGIAGVSAFAPLHNRGELEVIDVIEKLFGDIPQIAVFDTGFHRSIPPAAAVYPGPYEWFTEGIRRYGFHGINHQYCAGRAAQLLHRDVSSLKLVTCHLGNGCSLAAIQGGHSIDTTMGFTPLEGLMMGTRSGSVDPGILTYLLRQGHTGQDLDEILNAKSGLLGISGLSADMLMVVSAMQEGNARANLAFEVCIHGLRSGIGAIAATLSGMDALVFTAGIGENSAEVRAAACSNFAFLGLAIDPAKNLTSGSDRDIATTHSAIRVLVIHAQEDWAIARECWKLSLAAKAATQKHYNEP